MKIHKRPITIVISVLALLTVALITFNVLNSGGKRTDTPLPLTQDPETVVQVTTTEEPLPSSTEFVKAKAIKLNTKAVTLALKKTFKLKVTYTPANTTQKLLAFSTSNSNVATIDAKGVITAVAAGKSIITISINANKQIKASCTVTVQKATTGKVVALKGLSLNTKAVTLKPKQTYQLNVAYNPTTTTQKGVSWTTSNSKVANVDATGKITAVTVGTATITAISASNAKIKAVCSVAVKKPVLTYPENGLSKTTKVNLKLAFFQAGAGREWMDYAISAFHKKFPNVTIKMTASPTIDKVISTKLNANNDADMFDMFSSCRLIWQPYAENNKIDNLDALWSRHPYDSSQTLKSLTQPDLYKYQVYKNLGHTYGIPYGWHIAGSLYYHKEFFLAKKWNQAPKTYAQFTALCDTIKASGIYPMCFYSGYLYGLMKPKEFELAVENGHTKFDYNYRNYVGKQYTTPEAIEVYNDFYDMGKKKYFEPGSGTMSHIASQMNIIQHKVAMVVGGSWLQNEMKNNVPTGFSWGFMTLPLKSKTTVKAHAQLTAEDTQLVWSKKPTLSKKWSKEFILFMQNLDIQYQIAKKGGMLSTRTDYSNSSTRRAAYTGVLKKVVDAVNARTITAIELGSHAKKLKDPQGYGDIAYNMVSDIRVNVALGKTDPDATLESAETWYAKAQATGFK